MPVWFRKGPSPFQTPLAMIGAGAGDRVVVVGPDPALAAELARVTGLNGLTLVVDHTPGAAASVEAVATAAGALVEFSAALPAQSLTTDRFDIAVVVRLASIDAADRAVRLRAVLDVLRPGGRILVAEGARRTGLLSPLRGKIPTLAADDILALIDRAGGTAARLLGEADGVAYYEARPTRRPV